MPLMLHPELMIKIGNRRDPKIKYSSELLEASFIQTIDS
jgi:hypothetical protein